MNGFPQVNNLADQEALIRRKSALWDAATQPAPGTTLRPVAPRIAAPPPILPPDPTAAPAAPYGLDANTAALKELLAASRDVWRQESMIYRVMALAMISNPDTPATYFAPVVKGSSITTSYTALFTSTRQYPIGVKILVDWATAGAQIRLSKSTTDNGWYSDIANGGPTGGIGDKLTVLRNGEAVYAKDNGGGASPPAAGDKIHVLIIDPNELLQDPAWIQAMGYTSGGRP